MESCSSDYEPSSIVEAFHDIPHFDIDLNELNSTYESSVGDYFEAIIIWSCLPVLVGIALIILMFVVWGISWCCARWKKKEQPATYREPSRCLKGILVAFLLACALAGVIVCGGCFYAEVELNKVIVEMEDTVSLAESTVNNIDTQAESYNHLSIQTRQLGVKTELVLAGDSASIVILDQLNDTTSRFPGLYDAVQSLTEGYSLDGSADDIDKFETPRHWTIISVLILLVLLLVLLFVVVLLRQPILITLTAVAVFIFMILMWLATGAGLGAVIITADICHDPDGTVLSHTGSDNSEITEYFLFCTNSCGDDNPLVEAVNRLANVHNMAEEIFNMLNMSIGPTRREMLQESLYTLKEALDEGNATVNALTLLAECTALNNQYVDSRDDFCDMGFIYILTLFCAATFMALLLFCVLCVSKKYIIVLYSADRWDNTGFSYNFSPTPDIQSNGYNNGNNDTARQTSVRRKQQYDGWVAGKTHQGNYRHRGEGSTSAEPEYELQGGNNPPMYSDVLSH